MSLITQFSPHPGGAQKQRLVDLDAPSLHPAGMRQCWAFLKANARRELPGRRSLRSLLKTFDSAVAFGTLAPIASMIAGPVIMIAVSSQLTAAAQGYFYTFGSLLALQLLFDMGSAQVLLQFASHEWSQLAISPSGEILGSRVALSKLRSLLGFAILWALGVAVAAGVALGFYGLHLFGREPVRGVVWLGPWLALCGITGLNMLLTPIWSLLEGCNRITQVYAYRFFANVAQNVCICCALFLGLRLWAIPLGAGASLLVSCSLLHNSHRRFLSQIWKGAGDARISWVHELLPVQWRFALSWWSGYFLSYVFIPILFRYHGPELAGQMGMTWSMVATVGVLSTAWVSTKAAKFGVLIARREYQELDRLALRSGIACVVVAVLSAVGLEAAILLLRALDSKLAMRILPPLPSALFLLGMVLMQISAVQAVYLRAHKREPFAALSAVAALLVAGLSCYFGKWYGATGAAASYCGATLLFILPVATLIFIRCRRLWHI